MGVEINYEQLLVLQEHKTVQKGAFLYPFTFKRTSGSVIHIGINLHRLFEHDAKSSVGSVTRKRSLILADDARRIRMGDLSNVGNERYTRAVVVVVVVVIIGHGYQPQYLTFFLKS